MASGKSRSRQQRTHLVRELEWNKRSSLRLRRNAHGVVRNAAESKLRLLLQRQWLVSLPCRRVLLLAQHVCHSRARCVSCRRQGRSKFQVSVLPKFVKQPNKSARKNPRVAPQQYDPLLAVRADGGVV